MSKTSENLTIGALAKAAGVSVETIRFYQRRGLLHEPTRPYGGIRRYGTNAVARVRFIKSAKHLGFRLNEIGELLKLEDGTHCAEARALAEHKLAAVNSKLTELRHMANALTELIALCCAASGKVRCPLIGTLRNGD